MRLKGWPGWVGSESMSTPEIEGDGVDHDVSGRRQLR
jgi:hypothetical protein